MCTINTRKQQKIKNLLANWYSSTLASSTWLQSQGISRFLIARYVKSGWLKPAGRGVYSRLNDLVDWPGVLYGLQQDFLGTYHIGAISALQFSGLAHFIPMTPKPVLLLFTEKPYYEKNTPKWFIEAIRDHASFSVISKRLFSKKELGLNIVELHSIPLLMASPERAILELLALIPQKETVNHANYIMQGMGQIRHQLMQQLLECCLHKTAKRLFLHFAEKHNLPIMNSLNLKKIDLGTGRIQIGKGTHYDAKYQISIPEEITESEMPNV